MVNLFFLVFFFYFGNCFEFFEFPNNHTHNGTNTTNTTRNESISIYVTTSPTEEPLCTKDFPCTLEEGLKMILPYNNSVVYFLPGIYNIEEEDKYILNNTNTHFMGMGDSLEEVIIQAKKETSVPIFRFCSDVNLTIENLSFRTINRDFFETGSFFFQMQFIYVEFNQTGAKLFSNKKVNLVEVYMESIEIFSAKTNLFELESASYLEMILYDVNLDENVDCVPFLVHNKKGLSIKVKGMKAAKNTGVLDLRSSGISILGEGDLDLYMFESDFTSNRNGALSVISSNCNANIEIAGSNFFSNKKGPLLFFNITNGTIQTKLEDNVFKKNKEDILVIFTHQSHGESATIISEANKYYNNGQDNIGTTIIWANCESKTIDASFYKDEFFENEGSEGDVLMEITGSLTVNLKLSDIKIGSNFFPHKSISIDNCKTANVDVKNSIFSSNFGYWGGVFSIDFEELQIDATVTINLYNSTFERNTGQYGGVMYFRSNQNQNQILSVVAKKCDFLHHQSIQSGGVFYLNNKNEYDEKSQLTISNCLLKNNTAGIRGGALAMTNMNLTATNTNFFKNKASDGMGGSIDVYKGKIYLDDITCERSEAIDKGGCIYGESQKEFISKKAKFITNRGSAGGSIFLTDVDYLEMNEKTSITFSTSDFGGGMFIDSLGILNIENVVMNNNAAFTGGGGIFFLRDYIKKNKMKNVYDNTAKNGNDYFTSPKNAKPNGTKENICQETTQYNFECSLDDVVIFDGYGQSISTSAWKDFDIFIEIGKMAKKEINQKLTTSITFDLYLELLTDQKIDSAILINKGEKEIFQIHFKKNPNITNNYIKYVIIGVAVVVGMFLFIIFFVLVTLFIRFKTKKKTHYHVIKEKDYDL